MMRRPVQIWGLSAKGVTSLNGNRWVRVRYNRSKAYLPHARLGGTSQAALAALRYAGVIMTGADAAEGLAREVMRLSEFPPKPLADRIGWNGGYFACPCGRVIAPPGMAKAKAVFEAEPKRCLASGTLDGWKDGIAAPLMGQPLPMLAIMFAFVPAIRSLVPHLPQMSLEIVGRAGTRKGLLQKLAASLAGPPELYPVFFSQALADPARQLAAHMDLPMIVLDPESSLAGESPATRTKMFKAFVLGIYGETGRLEPRPGRYAFLSSSVRPLIELAGGDTDLANAASDKLITLAIAPERAFGVFDELPVGLASASEYADALITAASQHHGYPMMHFLRALVEARASDERGLRARIDRLIAQFRTLAAFDRSDSAADRVLSAFGLIYAAGKLAREWGVLPGDWECGPTVLNCYQRFLVHPGARRTFAEQLEAVGRSPEVIGFGTGLDAPTRSQIDAGRTFIRYRPQGRELLVRAEYIEAVFPGWRTLVKRPDVQDALIRDGRHFTTKRSIGSAKGVVMYCFRLPPQATVVAEAA